MNMVACAVERYLSDQQWRFAFNEENSIFDFNLSVKNCGAVRILILARERSICTYAILPEKVPRERRADAMEFVTRANYGINLGNFELDLRDGEVRFKSSLPCSKDCIPSQDVIERAIDIAFVMLDRYSVGLIRIMHSGMTAEEAISLVEGR